MRPETPHPLTPEEHRRLGLELRAANARLHLLCDLVVGVYGSNNRAAFSFQKAAEAMDRLCVDLETQAMRDGGGQKPTNFYQ
jgi:hypothetical protein